MNPSKEDPSLTVLPESPSIPFNDSTRCLYRFANGKRCRLTGSQPHFGLCPHHFNLTKPTASLECTTMPKTSLPISSPNSLSSLSIDLRQFLARLLTLVTKGRSLRRLGADDCVCVEDHPSK